MMDMISALKKKGAPVYFLMCMIIFMFTTYQGSELNEFIDFPHLEISFLPVYAILCVAFFFVVLLLTDNNVEIDYVAVILLFRIGFHFVQPIYMGMPSHFPLHLALSVICLVTYLIAKNFNANVIFFVKVMYVFFSCLVFQIVVEAYLSPELFFGDAYFFKRGLTLPIGASNALASKIIPVFAFLYAVSPQKLIKVVLVMVSFFVVALTKSRGGMMDLLVVFMVLSSWHGYFSMDSFFKGLAKIFIVVFIVACVIDNSGVLSLVFSNSDSTVVGRYALWDEGWKLFVKHPILGNGFYYTDLADNPHNFILDILMRSGVIGMLMFVALVVLVVKNIINTFSSDVVRGCFVAILCMLWHGCVEIVLFTSIHDIILWIFVGSMVRFSTAFKMLSVRV